MRNTIILTIIISTANYCFSQQQTDTLTHPIDLEKAEHYFNKVKELCEKDNGQLWGVNLYGPIMLGDLETNYVVCNLPDNEGKLKKKGNLYHGYFPTGKSPGNTSLSYGGTIFSCSTWDVLQEYEQQVGTNYIYIHLIHELFHLQQEGLGFPNPFSECEHLQQKEGRIWMRMELNALAEALNANTQEAINEHLTNALLFRNYRRKLFQKATKSEIEVEVSEGFADITGVIIAGDTSIKNILRIRAEERLKSYLYEFAYRNTPVYGYFLAQTDRKWVRELTPTSDIGSIVVRYFQLEIPKTSKEIVNQRATTYGIDTIRQSETAIEKAILERLHQYQAMFREEKYLALPGGFNFSFTSEKVLKNNRYKKGKFLIDAQLGGSWGKLYPNVEFLIQDNWKTAYVQLPADFQPDKLEYDIWRLELKEGWKIVRKKGNIYELKKK